jgi:zinc transport system substrate-binding protein
MEETKLSIEGHGEKRLKGILVKSLGYILGLTLCLSCVLNGAAALGAEGMPVFVSILPQKYFVERVGGDLVNVSVMVLPGAGPATYEPKPSQLTALSRAKIYYAIGVPFENVWLNKIAASNPKMRIVHTEEGIQKRLLAFHVHHTGDSREEERQEWGHDPVGTKDPHIWLSPPLVMLQARTILTALQENDPTHRTFYEANYKAFMMELLEIDAEIRDIFWGRPKGTAFMVFHPSWGYFAETYGLKQIPIEVEGKEPKPAQIKALIEMAREDSIKVIFVQPQFSIKRAEIIAKAIGGHIVSADPLAEDWARNLREQALKILTALKEAQ